MQHQKKEFINNDIKISYLDDVLLIIKSWKIIFSIGILGFIFSLIYILITPKQYEAIAYINIGRIYFGGSVIEEPQAVVNRISASNRFDPAIFSGCLMENTKNDPAYLLKTVKVSVPKGISDAVEVRVTSTNSEHANSCANKVFELIRKTQLEKIVQARKVIKVSDSIKIKKINNRLAQNQELLKRAELSPNLLSTYFTILSEIRTLEDQRDTLLTNLEAEPITTNLQSPIYVEHGPALSKKIMAIVAGLFGGLFLGLIVALVRPNFLKVKSDILKAI